MVGVTRALVKMMVVVLALSSAGCTSRSFNDQVLMHAALLRDEARKGVDVAVAGRFTAEMLAELLYPLAQARAFAEATHERLGSTKGPLGHATSPPVLRKLDSLITAYADLVDAIDQARRAQSGPVPKKVLLPALQEVERRADMVLHMAAP